MTTPVLAGAVCATVDPELWFPPAGGSTKAAKELCFTCPVRVACLEVAMASPVLGVWAGTTTQDRVRLAQLSGRRYLPVQNGPTACGTPAGARRHYRAGEKPCALCREGNRAAAQTRRAERRPA
jgi:hypothetical protein